MVSPEVLGVVSMFKLRTAILQHRYLLFDAVVWPLKGCYPLIIDVRDSADAF
jgi:hypothetical protein